MINRVRIVLPCLLVMMLLAEWLQIVQVILKLRVTTERSYVIDYSSLCQFPMLITLNAERVDGKVPPPEAFPLLIVASSVCRTHILRMHLPMLLAVLLAGIHQLRASRLCAWVLRLHRHDRHFLPRKKPLPFSR